MSRSFTTEPEVIRIFVYSEDDRDISLFFCSLKFKKKTPTLDERQQTTNDDGKGFSFPGLSAEYSGLSRSRGQGHECDSLWLPLGENIFNFQTKIAHPPNNRSDIRRDWGAGAPPTYIGRCVACRHRLLAWLAATRLQVKRPG